MITAGLFVVLIAVLLFGIIFAPRKTRDLIKFMIAHVQECTRLDDLHNDT